MSYSSSKKKPVRPTSLSMDVMVPEEVAAGKTGAEFSSGRLLDLKLRGVHARSSDAMASKSPVSSV